MERQHGETSFVFLVGSLHRLRSGGFFRSAFGRPRDETRVSQFCGRWTVLDWRRGCWPRRLRYGASNDPNVRDSQPRGRMKLNEAKFSQTIQGTSPGLPCGGVVTNPRRIDFDAKPRLQRSDGRRATDPFRHVMGVDVPVRRKPLDPVGFAFDEQHQLAFNLGHFLVRVSQWEKNPDARGSGLGQERADGWRT